ncbi:MAG: MATE family efflux transporter [Pikeienuella sp.]
MAERDLTSGPLAPHLVAMAVPASLGMLFTTLYNLVDTYYAGWISTDAQAGLALSFTIFMLLMSVGFGLSQGASALIGSALGAKDRDGARNYAAGALSAAVWLGVVLAVIGLLGAEPLLRQMGTTPEVLAASVDYLSLFFLGMPSFLVSFTANGVLSSQGDTNTNKQAQMVAFFANIGLNPLLMFGAFGVPGLGFNGIALSTIVIQTCAAVFMVRRALGTRAMQGCGKHHYLPSLSVVADFVRQGAPASLTMAVMMVGGFIIQVHLQPFGAAAVAGFGVAFRVEQLILLPILAISFALMPMVSQNFGAQDHDRVRQAVTLAVTVGLALALAGAVALALGGVALTRVFTDDPDAIASGAAYLRVAALMMPAYTAMFMITAFFQGIKRPIWSVVIGAYRQLFALAAFPTLFVSVLGWGLAGVWAGLFVAVWSGFVVAVGLVVLVARGAIGGIRPDFRAFDPTAEAGV